MSALALARGAAAAVRHWRLVAVTWAASFVPAAALAWLVSASLAPLDDRQSAARVLAGDWSGPLADLAGAAGERPSVLAAAVVLLLAASVVAQVLLAAGVAATVTGSTRPHPFWSGVRRLGLRFARAALWFALALAAAALAAGLAGGWLVDLAEARGDGRLDVAGGLVAVAVFALLWAPLAMAYDQARLAAAAHDERSTFLGFLRGLGLVLRRPIRFAVLAAASAAVPLAAVAAGAGLAALLPPAGWGLAALVVLQQLVMLARAAGDVALWGAQAALYRELGAPRLARPRRPPRPETVRPAMAADPAPLAAEAPAPGATLGDAPG